MPPALLLRRGAVHMQSNFSSIPNKLQTRQLPHVWSCGAEVQRGFGNVFSSGSRLWGPASRRIPTENMRLQRPFIVL